MESDRMKRFYSLLFFLALIFAVPLCARAEKGKCGNDARWELTNSGHLIISGSGRMVDYGTDRTPWFPSKVNSIEIADGITYIGSNAFANTRIKSVTIPNSVTEIGKKAFKKCKLLVHVNFSQSLRTIGDNAFADCEALPNVDLPESVNYLGNNAFADCLSLTSIAIPTHAASVGKDCFKNCKNVSRILEIPEFITTTNSAHFGINPHLLANFDYTSTRPQNQQNVNGNNNASASSSSASAVVTKAYGESDIDRYVPERARNNHNTFALVIANENYTRMSKVPYALNDGTSFVNYCKYTLGLPDTNITFVKDATYGNINEGLAWLNDIDDVFEGDMNVLVYYAGHGFPDEATREAYIVPVDAGAATPSSCYKLNNIYKNLGKLKAENVKVFLDACFSGATRTDDMIAEARGVALKPEEETLGGNICVLSATSDDQTAWQYEAEGHGLFTYFLLKKIKETGGNVTMGELSDYVTENVKKVSTVVNRKRQTPSVNISMLVNNNWRKWKLNSNKQK